MGEQDPDQAAVGTHEESFPERSELPDPRAFVVALVPLLAAMLPGAAIAQTTASGRARWSRVVTITRPRAQREVLEAALAEAITNDSAAVATQLLKHLGDFVDGEIAERGSVSLNVGLLVDAVAAVQQAGWSGDDATRFVVALQRSWSGGCPEENAYLQTLIDQVREGLPAEQLSAGPSARAVRERRVEREAGRRLQRHRLARELPIAAEVRDRDRAARAREARHGRRVQHQ
jgi:hypothetical protein